jgi:hypothetical protein
MLHTRENTIGRSDCVIASGGTDPARSNKTMILEVFMAWPSDGFVQNLLVCPALRPT